MKNTESIKKIILMVLGVLMCIAFAAAAIDPLLPWHPLQQIATDSSGTASVGDTVAVKNGLVSISNPDARSSNIRLATYSYLGTKYSAWDTILGTNVKAYNGQDNSYALGSNHLADGAGVFRVGWGDFDFKRWSAADLAGLTKDSKLPLGTTSMYINSAGQVGIGTKDPKQNFVVSNNGAEGLEVYLGQPAGTIGLQSYDRSASAYKKMQFDASQFAFTGGNVGIGTTTPDAKLTIDSSISGPNGWYKDIYFPNANHAAILTPNLLFGMHTSNKAFYFADITGNTFNKYLMYINGQTGNVGIGTTSPAHKLDVAGTYNVPLISARYDIHTASLGIDAANSYWGTAIFQDGNRVLTLDSNYGALIGQNYQTQNAPANGLAVEGNVGIGTTSPAAKLHVAGDIALTNANTKLQQGSGNALTITTDSGYVSIGPMNTGYSHFYTNMPRYYFNQKLVVGQSGAAGEISSYSGDLNLQTAETTRMILGSDGKVTIPGDLQVTGKITSSGGGGGIDRSRFYAYPVLYAIKHVVGSNGRTTEQEISLGCPYTCSQKGMLFLGTQFEPDTYSAISYYGMKGDFDFLKTQCICYADKTQPLLPACDNSWKIVNEGTYGLSYGSAGFGPSLSSVWNRKKIGTGGAWSNSLYSAYVYSAADQTIPVKMSIDNGFLILVCQPFNNFCYDTIANNMGPKEIKLSEGWNHITFFYYDEGGESYAVAQPGYLGSAGYTLDKYIVKGHSTGYCDITK